MVDFLKSNPAFSMQDVMWNLSVPFVKVMMMDATQVHYLSEKQAKEYKIKKNSRRVDDITELMEQFGGTDLPIIKE